MSYIVDAAKRPATQQFKDSTPLLLQPKELRARAEKDGYLFFRGLFNTDKLLLLRKQILEILQRWNLLDHSQELMAGIADYEEVNKIPDERVRGYGFPSLLYFEIQQLPLFQAILHDADLLNAFRVLFNAEPFPHPKTIARVVLPHRPAPLRQLLEHAGRRGQPALTLRLMRNEEFMLERAQKRGMKNRGISSSILHSSFSIPH